LSAQADITTHAKVMAIVLESILVMKFSVVQFSRHQSAIGGPVTRDRSVDPGTPLRAPAEVEISDQCGQCAANRQGQSSSRHEF
jgi:hypothetical protein